MGPDGENKCNMKRILTFLLLSALCGALSSCATIFCGSKKKVTFDSNIPVESATLTIDGRRHYNVTFPYVAKVKRGFDDTFVTAESEGYQKTNLTIEKNFNAVSVINLIDILGWGIDAATGAMMKPEYDSYILEFKQKEHSIANMENETAH